VTDRSVFFPDMTSSAKPARRRLPEERPQQILDAAFAVFGEHGLQGARLDDIAHAAGVAKGTIYLYFPNKEELFKEMIRSTMVERLERAEAQLAADASPTVTDRLRVYVHHWWEFLCCDRFQTVYPLLIGELKRFPELAEFYASDVVMRSRELVAGIMRQGIASGEFRPHVPDVSARILASMLVQHSLWVNRDVFDKFAGRSPETVRDEIFDYFLASIAAPAAASR
jgi:AcrR family transcriptional regulator